MVANYRCLEVRPGSMGKPVPGWDVDVARRDGGARAPDDVVGNIARALDERRPVGLFDEYFGDDEATPTPSATAATTPATRPGATATATSGSRAATTT